ncbi:unnamed protein product [Brassica oleracea var. botrytis]
MIQARLIHCLHEQTTPSPLKPRATTDYRTYIKKTERANTTSK